MKSSGVSYSLVKEEKISPLFDFWIDIINWKITPLTSCARLSVKHKALVWSSSSSSSAFGFSILYLNY